MDPFLVSVGVAFFLSIITVLADAFIKNASFQNGFNGWLLLTFGCLVYALTGLGWFFVMRHVKLSTSGVIYGITCILLLAAASVFYFKEKISSIEVVGICLAIISIIILVRFA